MPESDTIRSELSPVERTAVRDAYEALREPGAFEAAMKRWIDHENGPKKLTKNGFLVLEHRATANLMAERRAIVAMVINASQDMLTARGVAYLLLNDGLPKYDGPFRRVETSVLELRDSALIAWEKIADETRVVQRHNRWPDIQTALRTLANTYRRDLWAESPVQVQVWVEKRGVAAILAGHARLLGVDVFPMGGFTGAGFLRSAMVEAKEDGRPLVLLRMGDSDSSGLRASEAIARRARRDAAQLGVTLAEDVVNVAVTEDQIRDLGLLTRPNKLTPHWREGDPDQVVELDAMTPPQLRAALSDAIDIYLPDELRERAERTETEDRSMLAEIADEADE